MAKPRLSFTGTGRINFPDDVGLHVASSGYSLCFDTIPILSTSPICLFSNTTNPSQQVGYMASFIWQDGTFGACDQSSPWVNTTETPIASNVLNRTVITRSASSLAESERNIVNFYNNSNKYVSKKIVPTTGAIDSTWMICGYNGGSYLNGQLLGFRFYARVLTDAEILKGNTQGIWPTDNLLIHYPLQTGSGTIATDISGNNRHGTIVNGTWVTTGIDLPINIQKTLPTTTLFLPSTMERL